MRCCASRNGNAENLTLARQFQHPTMGAHPCRMSAVVFTLKGKIMSQEKIATSFKALAANSSETNVKKTDLYRIPPEKIQEEPGFKCQGLRRS